MPEGTRSTGGKEVHGGWLVCGGAGSEGEIIWLTCDIEPR